MKCCDEPFLFSQSCLIDEGQSFLLTGGYDFESGAVSRVSRYDINGWLEDLDDLNTERRLHGCTQFTNNEGDKVRKMEFRMMAHMVSIVCMYR